MEVGLSGLRGASLDNTVYMFGEDLLSSLTFVSPYNHLFRRSRQQLQDLQQNLEVHCSEQDLGERGNYAAREVLPRGLRGQSQGFLS